MAESQIGKLIDSCVALKLAPLLKADGYLKRGRLFHRKSHLAIHIVRIQGNRHNSGDRGSFVVNLGVYFPEVARLTGHSSQTEFPWESECTVRDRLGILMTGNDQWWEPAPGIAEEIASGWVQYGKPWMERYATPEGALPAASAFHAAAIHLLAGRKEAAAERIDREIRKSSVEPYRMGLRRWAMEQGLVLAPPEKT